MNATNSPSFETYVRSANVASGFNIHLADEFIPRRFTDRKNSTSPHRIVMDDDHDGVVRDGLRWALNLVRDTLPVREPYFHIGALMPL